MLVKAHADYQCGGYPSPAYQGTLSVALNIHQDATDDQIEEELTAKAKKMIGRNMCMDSALITIRGLSGIERTLADYEYDRIHA